MSLVESLLQSQPQKFGLWPSVWKLLRLRVRIMWNGFIRAKTRQKIGRLVLLALLLGGMAFLFFISSLVLRLVQSPELRQYVDPVQFIDAIPTLILTAAFLLTIMTNFGVLLQSLYLSRDMDFLVTSPLPMRAVFLAKLLEAILPNFALFCAFSLPLMFGLGASSGYTILYYPLLLVMLALLALAAGGLAAILVMAVVRVVPARRVAEVLGFLGAMVSLLCGQSGNIMRAMNLQGSDYGATLGAMTRVNTPWSPLAWAGRGLLAVGRGEWLTGLPLTLLSLALAGALFTGALFLAEHLYYTGWASMQGHAPRKRRVKTPAAPQPAVASADSAGTLTGGAASTFTGAGAVTAYSAAAQTGAPAASAAVPVSPSISPAARGELFSASSATSAGKATAGRLIPRPVLGLIIKDLLLLRRDPRNLSQLITPLILGFVFMFSSRGGGEDFRRAAEFQNTMRSLMAYVMVLFALFVGWMLLMNLASLAFSREGRSYWLIKAAPIKPWHLLGSKFIISYLPAVLLSLLFLTVSFALNGLAWGIYPYCALIVLMSVAGANGIALSFGVAGANLEWDSPQRQRLRGASGCLMVILVAAFLFGDLLLFLLPPGIWQVISLLGSGGFSENVALPTAPFFTYLIGLVIGSAGALAAVYLPLRLVFPKLARIGEAG